MSYLYRNKDNYISTDDYSEDGSDIGSDNDIFNRDTMADKDITANFKRLMNPNSLMKIIRIIENNIKRQLNYNERLSIKQLLLNDVNAAYSYRKDPTNRFYLGNLQNFNTDIILQKISNKWIKNQKQLINDRNVVEDVHEMLKKEIGTTAEAGVVKQTFIEPLNNKPQKTNTNIEITKFLNLCTQQEIMKIMNPYNMISHNYIYLDSRLRNIAGTDGITSFQWDEDNTGSINPGKFSYLGKMRDIIEIKVLPFRIPYATDESADNVFRSITIYFEEFANQSYIGRGNRRFHILCEVGVIASYIQLLPYQSNNGIFRFDKPITELSKLTVSFGAPINLINFDPDRSNCTFSIGLPTIVTTTIIHNLSTGDSVTFINFTTLAPLIDAATIFLINNLNGLIVTVLTPTTFSIDIDTILITPNPSLSIVCIFESKTFKIPVEFKFIRPRTYEN